MDFFNVQSISHDRFNVSDIPTKTTGFTPIVYTAAQGMFWKLRYSAGINWQLNRISYENIDADVKNHNTQWAINPTIQIMMPFGSKMNHALIQKDFERHSIFGNIFCYQLG